MIKKQIAGLLGHFNAQEIEAEQRFFSKGFNFYLDEDFLRVNTPGGLSIKTPYEDAQAMIRFILAPEIADAIKAAQERYKK